MLEPRSVASQHYTILQSEPPLRLHACTAVRQVRRTLGGTWRHWPGLLCSLKTTPYWGREIDRVEEVQSKGTEDKVAGRQLPIDVRPFLKVAPALPKTQGKRNGH